MDRVEFLHGLRDFGVTPGGLRWNGRAFPLQGVDCDHLTEAAARRLRSDGSNLLLATSQNAANLCAITHRLGFLIFARVAGREGYHDLRPLAGHPSWLGCLLEEQWLDDPVIHNAGQLPGGPQEQKVVTGIELKNKPVQPLPSGCQFILCDEELVPLLVDLKLPKLIRRGEAAAARDRSAAGQVPGFLGWIAG